MVDTNGTGSMQCERPVPPVGMIGYLVELIYPAHYIIPIKKLIL